MINLHVTTVLMPLIASIVAGLFGAKIGRESRGTDSKIRQRRVDSGRRRRSETRGGYLQGEELEEDWCVRAERKRERERG